MNINLILTFIFLVKIPGKMTHHKGCLPWFTKLSINKLTRVSLNIKKPKRHNQKINRSMFSTLLHSPDFDLYGMMMETVQGMAVSTLLCSPDFDLYRMTKMVLCLNFCFFWNIKRQTIHFLVFLFSWNSRRQNIPFCVLVFLKQHKSDHLFQVTSHRPSHKPSKSS